MTTTTEKEGCVRYDAALNKADGAKGPQPKAKGAVRKMPVMPQSGDAVRPCTHLADAPNASLSTAARSPAEPATHLGVLRVCAEPASPLRAQASVEPPAQQLPVHGHASAQDHAQAQSQTQDQAQASVQDQAQDQVHGQEQAQLADSFDAELAVYVDGVHREWLRRCADMPSCMFAAALHPNISAGMRDVLVDWLWDVYRTRKMSLTVICLTLQLVDRRLATGPAVDRGHLQRTGMACLLLASKLEEIEPVSPWYVCPLAAGSVTLAQLLSTERNVCRVLRHDFALPTAFHFLTYYCHLTVPGSAALKAAAFAALHATTLSGTYASASPQLAAAGSVAWAAFHRHVMPPATFLRSKRSAPAHVVAQEHQQAKTETVQGRAQRHWRTLLSVCGLSEPCLKEAYWTACRHVASQCAMQGPGAESSSFLKLWLHATKRPASVEKAARRIADALAREPPF
jgi:hypothetical protein